MATEPTKTPRSVELPEPTAWPVICAFGLTLLFAGLVTSLIISFIGLLIGVVGAIGWFGDVFPHPRHEAVPVEADPVPATSARSVAHLKIGEQGHRARLPILIPPFFSGVLGGIAGAVVMAFLACAWGQWKYGSIWYPINLLAAAAVPELATAGVETLKQFSFVGFAVAVVSHFSISIMIGFLYIVLLPMLPAKFQWFWGGIMTPIIWTAFIFATLRFVSPTLATYVDWPWFVVCQVAFGMVCGFVVFKQEQVETMQSWTLAAKLGVEAPQKEK
jgi:MFS family permease